MTFNNDCECKKKKHICLCCCYFSHVLPRFYDNPNWSNQTLALEEPLGSRGSFDFFFEAFMLVFRSLSQTGHNTLIHDAHIII